MIETLRLNLWQLTELALPTVGLERVAASRWSLCRITAPGWTTGPAVTDGFAASRPVILFDNAGAAGSSGETPNTMEATADNAANFLGALGVATVDVLGHSIGGYIAKPSPFVIRKRSDASSWQAPDRAPASHQGIPR
jgi:hypothetical protein